LNYIHLYIVKKNKLKLNHKKNIKKSIKGKLGLMLE